MFQTVGHEGVTLYAEAMDLPLYRAPTLGQSRSREMEYQPCEGDEVEDLYQLLKTVKVCGCGQSVSMVMAVCVTGGGRCGCSVEWSHAVQLPATSGGEHVRGRYSCVVWYVCITCSPYQLWPIGSGEPGLPVAEGAGRAAEGDGGCRGAGHRHQGGSLGPGSQAPGQDGGGAVPTLPGVGEG